MTISYHQQHIVTLLSGVTVAAELLLRSKPQQYAESMLGNPDTLVKRSLELTRQKVKHARELVDSGVTRTIFVNYSPCQVESPCFMKCLDELDVLLDMGALVVIEITENSIYTSVQALEKNAQTARQRGYFIAIDDFGAGESNFNALFKLQPSIVKLDYRIIREAEIDERSREGFYQLTELLRNLNFRVVVEGIETKSQLSVARHAQADFAQGFHFHHPEPILAEENRATNNIAPFNAMVTAI